MMEPLSLNEKIAKDLLEIAQIGALKLEDLATDLEKAPRFLPSKDLLKVFEKSVGSAQGRSLLSFVASLSLKRDDDGSTSEEVFQALYDGIVDAENTELEEAIAGIKIPFVRLIDSEAVYLSVKGARLFAVDALHVHDFSIFCDSRPVFGPNRKNIKAFLLFSSLNIVASDDHENEERYTVALRQKDLKKIIKECQTALGKLDALEQSVASIKGMEVIRYGSD